MLAAAPRLEAAHALRGRLRHVQQLSAAVPAAAADTHWGAGAELAERCVSLTLFRQPAAGGGGGGGAGSDDDSGNEPTHADSEEDSDSAVDLASLDISGADTGASTRARGGIEENDCVHREDRDTRDRSGSEVIRKPGT